MEYLFCIDCGWKFPDGTPTDQPFHCYKCKEINTQLLVMNKACYEQGPPFPFKIFKDLYESTDLKDLAQTWRVLSNICAIQVPRDPNAIKCQNCYEYKMPEDFQDASKSKICLKCNDYTRFDIWTN